MPDTEPKDPAVPMRDMIEAGLKAADAKSPVWRTAIAICVSVICSGGTAGGMLIWLTQHDDMITNTLNRHTEQMNAFALAQKEIAQAIKDLSGKEGEIANAVGRLQQRNDDQDRLGKRGDVKMPAALDMPG